jgi:hypothetical protein
MLKLMLANGVCYDRTEMAVGLQYFVMTLINPGFHNNSSFDVITDLVKVHIKTFVWAEGNLYRPSEYEYENNEYIFV